MTLLVFHFEISGNDDRQSQFENNSSIFGILLVFQFEISGRDDKDLQL